MKDWNEKAQIFYDETMQDYQFDEHELAILRGACQSLSNFWDAQELLTKDGLVLAENGKMTRKNPACEVQKYSWAMFLQSCKHLGIGMPKAPEKRPYGVL